MILVVMSGLFKARSVESTHYKTRVSCHLRFIDRDIGLSTSEQLLVVFGKMSTAKLSIESYWSGRDLERPINLTLFS